MRKIVGASIGDCVHVAGVVNFLRLAEDQGWETTCLGPAVPVKELVGAVLESNPDMIAVGYRLTPDNALPLFEELRDELRKAGLQGKKLVFGGTPPVANVARSTGLFDEVFGGEETIEDIIAFLKGKKIQQGEESYPGDLAGRLEWKEPFPLIRHHFGLPSMEATIEGVRKIAGAKVLDVLSIGPDQAAQEAFFRPEELRKHRPGAGGVPVRSRSDLVRLYEESRCGNYPLLRCYSGTRDVFQWAEMLVDTIKNAWCAVPLMWYNVLDRRGPRSVPESIAEGQRLMAWHAERGIPVEVNEAHHWSLRDAHDTIAVAMAFLAAYNAKKAGVSRYVAQYMFNTPPATSPAMDLAKMLAKKELISSLEDDGFEAITQVRAGLSSFPVDLDSAKGQLAYSTFLGMALKPQIVHVVGYCEADHAAEADDVIESCKIARRVIEECLHGLPDMTLDPVVDGRRKELVSEARVLLSAITRLGRAMGSEDPWTDPAVLTRALETGLLDAPHLKNTPPARGRLQTRMVDGACRAVDPATGRVLSETERIEKLAD